MVYSDILNHQTATIFFENRCLRILISLTFAALAHNHIANLHVKRASFF